MKARHKIALPRLIPVLGVCAAGMGLLAYPAEAAEAARQAVEVSLALLIPSLFPFFVVSSLILACGYADAASRAFAPLMHGIFGVGGACAPAFLLGLIGGYPVGARTAIALYRRGSCTKEEAERMLAFCNNSGPAFILGVVGTGILGSARAGVLLYAAHVLAGVTVGIVFRFWKGGQTRLPQAAADPGDSRFLPCFLESVRSAGVSVLSLSAFVVTFSVLIALLIHSRVLTAAASLLGRFGMDPCTAQRLLTGFLEVTAGLQSLAELSLSLTEKMAAASCMLGWAGLCVHCQVLSFLQASGLSARPYLLGKLAQGALATLYIRLLLSAFPVAQATSAMAERMERLAGAGAVSSGLTAVAGALGVMWVIVIAWRVAGDARSL